MKRVYVDELKPGDKLAWPVYLGSGEILLEAGKVLTEEDIDRLHEWRIVEVLVEGYDELERELEEEKILKEVFREAHRQAVEHSKRILRRFSKNERVNREEIEKVVLDTLENLSINKDVLLAISTYLKGKEEYLFTHSVNTMVTSLAIGGYLGYDRERLELIGIGAILHDVGLIQLSERRKIRDEDDFKEHPEVGLKIIRSLIPNVHPIIANIVLEHHERKNGSGYPNGLRGNEIATEAMIVGVADVFERLTSPNFGDRKLSPFEAMKYILSHTSELFDVRVVEALMRVMVIYPLGSLVRLSTGEIGRVAASTDNPFRPKVNIIFDRFGKPMEKVVRIDLTAEGNRKLFITEVLDESELDLDFARELAGER
ncbi:MAG: HD domain-containing protein [Synergistetes bacterium]|nr:HD domain-containing protein [Synergistota bacterium]